MLLLVSHVLLFVRGKKTDGDSKRQAGLGLYLLVIETCLGMQRWSREWLGNVYELKSYTCGVKRLRSVLFDMSGFDVVGM